MADKQVSKSEGMAKATQKASNDSNGKTWWSRHSAKQVNTPPPKYQAK